MTRLPAYAISLLALVTCVASANSASVKAAGEEDWIIRSFAASYTLERTGRLSVTEEITVDFGNLERHGIFRDIPVEYSYDSESNRLIDITAVAVTEGGSPVRFQTDGSGPLLRIKIGDPDKLVTGEQHYVIDYTVSGALNPFPDHDEMYWNVTGNEWPVRIEQGLGDCSLSRACDRENRLPSGTDGLDGWLRVFRRRKVRSVRNDCRADARVGAHACRWAAQGYRRGWSSGAGPGGRRSAAGGR